MDSNELSQAIRKIIGYPEKINQSQAAKQGKRVFGGVGEYWYNGNGGSGDKKGDKKGGGKKGGGKKGGGDADPVGAQRPRLEGLHACGTGHCVAAN